MYTNKSGIFEDKTSSFPICYCHLYSGYTKVEEKWCIFVTKILEFVYSTSQHCSIAATKLSGKHGLLFENNEYFAFLAHFCANCQCSCAN